MPKPETVRPFTTLSLILVLLVTGCSAYLPGQQAAEWTATKSAAPISIAMSLDQRIVDIVPLIGQTDPLGSLLPVRPVVEGTRAMQPVQYLICEPGKMAVKCASIPVGARIKVVGRSRGPSVWELTRLSVVRSRSE
jgi:hypothetical protein